MSNWAQEWAEQCELTVRKILKRGFSIESLYRMSSIELGKELRTGVILVISSGNRAVYNVDYRDPGIREGLLYMARHGLDEKMVIYGLGFQFKRFY
ncbi:hypothetical protein F4815DRAFT_174652 [Daldinia loculata]|uniref:uncharacterized protein n=1 Tax=Daldinia loculata TaxID=103429 RepID=UPI0020C3B01B|nr:uncharacterized protein F4817DRAFT_319608 [Daldinia loculata]KAI1643605.1 hypothetical protein F4817DRAFT_319608 [Daldinia loculata]KAI2779853.1 hypothetical protein F4815DRAFT_174652 [Daldinia loculata]